MEGIFEDRLVALNGPVNYPPRSPDLTVMDIWVFAYIKGKSITINAAAIFQYQLQYSSNHPF